MLTALLISGVALADTSEPQHFQVEDTINLWEYTTADTGWWPASGFAQVRFFVEANGTTSVKMEGDSHLEWDDSGMALHLVGEPGSGVIDLDVELSFEMQVALEFDVLTMSVDWSDTVKEESVRFTDRQEFDSWNFSEDGWVTTGAPEGAIEVFRVGLSPVPGVDLNVLSHLEPTLNAKYQTARIDTEYGSIASATEGLAVEPVADQAALPVTATILQSWQSEMILEMRSGVEVCVDVVGCFDELAIDSPFDTLTESLEQPFEPVSISHPLPVLNTETESINFGDVLVGNAGVHELYLDNPGELTMLADASIDGDDAFRTFPDSVTAAPEGNDGIVIIYEPSSEGEHRADLVFASNDPARPELRIELLGTAIPLPAETEEADTGVADTAESDGLDGEADKSEGGGCACSAVPSPNRLWSLLVPLSVLMLRRRYRSKPE